MPGIESRLALLYTYGVGAGRLSLERWVEVCCTAPARILGLYPRKGALIPGADADVVLFDPDRAVILSRSVLHENCDYTPFDGCQLKGYPALTMLRGRVIAREGEFVGRPGGGRFLARRQLPASPGSPAPMRARSQTQPRSYSAPGGNPCPP